MEDYSCRTDEEVLYAFRGGDKAAGEELLFRYKNKVLSIARRFFLAGSDTEDLVQEGMCGLYSAMLSFEGQSGFSSYAYACIKNRILDAIKKSGSNKNLALNGFISISEDEQVVGEVYSPEEALIDDESKTEFMNKMKNELSSLEYRAICMYIDGSTMAEISSALGVTYKQTDNAIARAKKKLRNLFE